MGRLSKKYDDLLEEHQDTLVKEWVDCLDKRDKYNGFSRSKADEIKQSVYNGMMIKLSYDVFYRLKLEKYFGVDYSEKFFEILTKRKDYDILMFLFDDLDGEHPRTLSLKEVKDGIDSSLKRVLFLEKTTYQGFYFSNSIKEAYYQGDLYIGSDELPENEQAQVQLEIIRVNKAENFFPQLTKDLHNIIGDENCEYDFYEMGGSGFMLFWSITTEVYLETMNRIKEWMNYNELGEHLSFRIKDLTDSEKFLETVGNKKVISDYYGK